MPIPSENCQRLPLARLGSYRVDRCSCGAIHVSAGPVTLHMDAGAFRQLLATLVAGGEQLERACASVPRLSVVADEGGVQ